MQVVALGPWVLPVGIIAIALGWLGADACAYFLRQRGYADAAKPLWWLIAAALIAGRAAFVLRWWPEYRASAWWSVIDIRDRGFEPWAALATLIALALLLAWRRRPLRRALPIAAGSGLAVMLVTLLIGSQLHASVHPPLPNVALRQLDGQQVTLASLGGKPLVINLWATWCGPCRAEMPMLLAASRTTPGVRFVFVDQGEPAATVQAFLKQQAIQPAHVLLDANNLLTRDYRVLGYPTTLFVAADGTLRDMQTGPLSRATLAEHLQRIDGGAVRAPTKNFLPSSTEAP